MRRSCDTSEHSRAVDITGPMSVAIRLKTGPQRRRRTPRHGATKRSSHPPPQRRGLDVETNKLFFFFSQVERYEENVSRFWPFRRENISIDSDQFGDVRHGLAQMASIQELPIFFFVLKATGQFAFTDLRLTCRVEYNCEKSAAWHYVCVVWSDTDFELMWTKNEIVDPV